MKLSCAVVACNENPHYLQFWPIVKRAWWEFLHIPCIMVYVGKELPLLLQDDPAVIQWNPVDGWPTATQAQVIRLLYPALLKCDGAVVVSDMDIIPMQKDFFVKGFQQFQDHQFVSLRGIDEGEKQIYMCYVGATPKTWSDLFQIQSKEDIYKRMKNWANETPADGNHGGLGWCTDQLVLYRKVKEWQNIVPERVGLVPWTQEISRLDRGNPYEWFQWNSMLETKLQNNAYVDFHMPPYIQFKQQIDTILDYTLNKPKNSEELPKVLMLILASDTKPTYKEFQNIWRQYMNSHPNIDCYFYKADPTLKEEALLLDKNTLVVKCEESLTTCYEKTILALKYFSSQFDKYQYIFRPNLSSFIVFDRYLEFCKTLPKASACSAFIGTTDTNIQFPSGSGFTMTPDLALRFIQERPPFIEQDDVSIGHALKAWNISIVPAPRTDILVNEHVNSLDTILLNNKTVFHYRVKHLSGNRNIDIQVLSKLLKKYY